jgi:hypothetical protein
LSGIFLGFIKKECRFPHLSVSVNSPKEIMKDFLVVGFALFRSLGPVRWRWHGWPAGQILGHGQGLSACRPREMAHPAASQGVK